MTEVNAGVKVKPAVSPYVPPLISLRAPPHRRLCSDVCRRQHRPMLLRGANTAHQPSPHPTPQRLGHMKLYMKGRCLSFILPPNKQVWNFQHFRVFMFPNVPGCILCSCFSQLGFFSTSCHQVLWNSFYVWSFRKKSNAKMASRKPVW